LSGQDDAGQPFVAGVYPMLLDETCFFLAIDFDNQSWTEDAQAYVETCRRMSIPAALERSRSGCGGHVWCFFAEAVPAALARRLGSYVLTESMARRPDIGFQSYDRFFPSQDTLPRGGFGRLTAKPPMQWTASSCFASASMSARNDRHGSGGMSEGIPQILGTKRRQEIPVRRRFRTMLTEILTLRFGNLSSERVLLRKTGFLKLHLRLFQHVYRCRIVAGLCEIRR
jgi:hypothetical protein